MQELVPRGVERDRGFELLELGGKKLHVRLQTDARLARLGNPRDARLDRLVRRDDFLVGLARGGANGIRQRLGDSPRGVRQRRLEPRAVHAVRAAHHALGREVFYGSRLREKRVNLLLVLGEGLLGLRERSRVRLRVNRQQAQVRVEQTGDAPRRDGGAEHHHVHGAPRLGDGRGFQRRGG